MAQITLKITVNGNLNLGEALKAANYGSDSRLSTVIFFNPNATTLFVNLTNGRTTAPADGTVGFPVGSGGAATTLLLSPPNGAIDSGLVWLNSAVAVEIKILIIGG